MRLALFLGAAASPSLGEGQGPEAVVGVAKEARRAVRTGSGRGGAQLDLKVSGRKRGRMALEAEGARQRGLGLTSPLSCTNLALGLRPDRAAGAGGRPSPCQAWRTDGAGAFLAGGGIDV